MQGCSSVSFSGKAADQIPAEVRETLEPLLRLIQTLSEEIKSYDEAHRKAGQREAISTRSYCGEVNGVGPVTLTGLCVDVGALRYDASGVAIVGPYLGLVPPAGGFRRQPAAAGQSARLATGCCANCWWAARITSWPVRAGHRLTTIRNETLRAWRKERQEASFCRGGHDKLACFTASALVERRSLREPLGYGKLTTESALAA